MPCPTCSHTLECAGSNERGDNFLHCPRCGTLLVDAFGQHGDKVYVPKLVERCREFAGLNWTYPDLIHGHMRRLGILESINKPEDRR